MKKKKENFQILLKEDKIAQIIKERKKADIFSIKESFKRTDKPNWIGIN